MALKKQALLVLITLICSRIAFAVEPPELTYLSGETVTDYGGLLHEILRVSGKTIEELQSLAPETAKSADYAPKGFVPRPSFVTKENLSDKDVTAFSDFIKEYRQRQVAPLIHFLQVSHRRLMKGYRTRYHRFSGFKDLNYNIHEKLKAPIQEVKNLTDALIAVQVGLDALRARALEFPNLQPATRRGPLSYGRFMASIQHHLFFTRLGRAHLAWLDLRTSLSGVRSRNRAGTLRPWMGRARTVNGPTFAAMSLRFRDKLNEAFKKIRLLGQTVDRHVHLAFPQQGRLDSSMSPADVQTATAQAIEDIQNSLQMLHAQIFPLFEFARDLRAAALENNSIIASDVLNVWSTEEKKNELAKFETAVRLLVGKMGFLTEAPQPLAKLWLNHAGFTPYIEGKLSEWDNDRRAAFQALTDLALNGCEKLLE